MARKQSTHSLRATLVAALVALFALTLIAGPAIADADSPTVESASGGAGVPLIFGHFPDAAAIGYDTAEFFLSGNAHSYTTGAPLTPDGEWNAIAANLATAAYKTRVIVHKPIHPRRFRGTVYVEWLNVSGGLDAAPDWQHGHIQMLREGAAWVGVSAQFVGVNQLKNGGAAPGDPARYGSLVHPTDSYSYDIYSQAGQAVWDGALLGDYVPQRVIALGESQSAGRLVTYVNAIQSLVGVYDGFVVHSRGAGGAALSQTPLPSIPVTLAAIRDDIATPVIVFQAEGDVANSRLLARQPESETGNYRLWEVAGTAHFDLYGLDIANRDVGNGDAEIENLAAMQNPTSSPTPGVIECALPINTGPMHWVYNASLNWINRWVRFGTAPPIASRLEATSAPGAPVVFALDVHENVLGGIRTPHVDVPIAKLTGGGNTGAPGAPPQSAFCFLFGQTVPFSAEKIDELYPQHGAFVFPYVLASLEAVHSRYLLMADAVKLIRAAAQSAIGQ